MKIVVTKESIYLVGAEDSTPEEIENGYVKFLKTIKEELEKRGE